MSDYQRLDKPGLTRVINGIASKVLKLKAALSDIVNVYGAKNLLPNNATTQTKNGITFTVNSDGSVTANGTASNNTRLVIMELTAFDFSKPLVLNGGANGNCVTIAVLYNSSKVYLREYSSNGADRAISDVTNAKYLEIIIWIANGTVCNNVVFKPMIRLASIEDGTYVPYAMTNQQLTGLYDNEVEMGAVNLLPNTGESITKSGVTFTVNSDGTVTLNGTAIDNGWYFPIFVTYDSNEYPLIAGKRYKLSGCPSGGSQETFRIYLEMNGVYIEGTYDTGNGVTFTAPVFNVKFGVYIRIYPGHTFNNKVFKPMITFASQPNSDYAHYVPYAKSNKELTDDKAEKNDLTSINITSGTTNNTGSTIASGTFFYYKGSLVRAKTDIANGATLTQNTNYESVTAGGLNALNSELTQLNSDLAMTIIRKGSKSISCSANNVSEETVTFSVPLTNTELAAVTGVVLTPYYTNQVILGYKSMTNNGFTIQVRNVSQADVSSIPIRYMVY